jgi:LysM repeat protein
MRALFGNNCAKGCLIYIFALGLIVMVTSMGLSGLSARFGAAQVQGNKPDLSVPQAGQDVTALQSQLSSVVQDGFSGGLPPTPTRVPPPTLPPSQPGPQPTSAPLPPAQGQGGTITGETSPPFYIVQPGDSLWSIAHKFGVDIDTLRAINNISGNIIYPGQVIYLPTPGQPASPPAPTARPTDPPSGAQSGSGVTAQSAGQGSAVLPNMPDTGITSRKP